MRQSVATCTVQMLQKEQIEDLVLCCALLPLVRELLLLQMELRKDLAWCLGCVLLGRLLLCC